MIFVPLETASVAGVNLNSAPAIVVASPSHSGERLLLLRAAGGLVTENSPVAFASRTGKPRPIIRNRWTPVTSNAVAKGSYAVSGAVRIDHHGRSLDLGESGS